ncbi:MAG TPA: aminotransferase class I/II-fold pyridoxal phosphate-dependent enzyme, partial [Burkholderiaceae bacterium]|nr:aminotransferase class I/II-fold pyridoxal phosphate-dependent enzyme [Burkholderiaceae bacterium]
MQQPDLSVIRDDVRAMSVYAVPDATGLIKLDAMENPFGLPHELAQTLGAHLASVSFNRYPPSNPSAFKSRLAAHMGVPGPSYLLLGNGSDELIHLVCQACAKPGATVLSPWPSFSMYEVLARLNQCRFVGVPLRADFQLDGPALLAAIAEHRPAVTFVAYPNNPTRNLFDRQLLAQAIEAAAPGLVVIDEAYLPYARDTWMPQLGAFPNLMVLRTISKLGLAGLRLGYLAARPAWVRELDKVRPPYNINALTLAATNFFLEYLEV